MNIQEGNVKQIQHVKMLDFTGKHCLKTKKIKLKLAGEN